MARVLMVLFTPAFLLIFTGFCDALAENHAPDSEKIRVGTYESRAVAIAYAASRFNLLKDKMADYERAKATGDQERMKELEILGKEHQRQLHFQGFGRVPVGDLLELVKEQVAKIGRERRLAAITMSCDFTSNEVELVDITDELVKLFEPSEKTLEHVRQIRKVKPIPLTQLGGVPARE